jgi:DNA repair protein RecN (Recombination protein N)
MLRELHIRDFALIDKVDLEFGPGLNLLTGETGAGKSIIIDAMGLVLGDRVTASELVRAGAKRCSVEAHFTCTAGCPAGQYLADRELVHEDNENDLVVSRELTISGKSQARINGRIVTSSSLKELGELIVDVHGQTDHQSLLRPSLHLELLDSWLGEDLTSLRTDTQKEFSQASSLARELHNLQLAARERVRNLDLYRFQLEEITAANPKPGEEEDLLQERNRLANIGRLLAAADTAYSAIQNGALDALNSALGALERVEQADASLQDAVTPLRDALAYAEDFRDRIRGYRENLEDDPARQEEIEERIGVLRSLARKYGDTVEDILVYAEGLARQLEQIEHQDQREEQLGADLAESTKRLESLCGKLTARRKAGCAKFAAAVRAELADLGMQATKFEVALEAIPPAANGADKAEFVISPNPGEPLRPLAKVASGGETSRIMLALKSVLSKSAHIPTLIFDEVDVGVGGRTGAVIGAKLQAISNTAQVLCITHLPQVASRHADAHFQIEKRVVAGRTTVAVNRLDATARVLEIARMLGSDSSPTVLQHAREMLLGM